MNKTKLVTYQLAFDPEEYVDQAGKWVVTSEDGEKEYTGPMEQEDAENFVALFAACEDPALIARIEKGAA